MQAINKLWSLAQILFVTLSHSHHMRLIQDRIHSLALCQEAHNEIVQHRASLLRVCASLMWSHQQMCTQNS